jgi:hypothetical protein
MRVVAMVAQALVIRLVPKQFLIASMRLDVIHHRGYFSAFNAIRMAE